MLQAPVQEPPHPPLKQYECPLCQETVGRKALWVHLKREHQATKEDAFEFVPERDMLPGSLTCRHYYSSFTMEQELVTHFKRSSCPVLTCDWAGKLHFGSHSGPPIPVDDHMDPSLPVLLHRYFDLSHPGLIGHNLHVSTIDIVDCWFPLLYAPTSYPINWLAHFPDLPHTCFVTDQVFSSIHALRAQRPVCWAWTLDCEQSPDIRYDCMYIHDSLGDQMPLVKAVIMCIAQILARNRDLQLSLSHDGTSDRRRSILHGSARGLHGWLSQTPEDRLVIRWNDDTWPGAARAELKLLSEHLGWQGSRSAHSFLNALRSQSQFVCLQLERYPTLCVRHAQAISWEHNRISLPVFDGASHCSVTWHDFQVIAAVLHTGVEPTSGHYRAVLFNSGSGLQCEDNRPCQRLVRDRTFYEEVYMLWLAPWAQTCQEYRIPLPNLHTLQQATLAKLISTHFD